MDKRTNSRPRPASKTADSRRSAPKAQSKPKRINMDAAAEDSTPANVMWKLGILACTLMVVVSLLFACINGGSVYVGKDAKASPTPPVSSTLPDDGANSTDGTQDGGDGTQSDGTQDGGQQ